MAQASSTLFNNDALQRSTIAREAPDRAAKICFVFLWLLTFVIYARPEDMFPALESLHLTLFFAVCTALTCLGTLLLGHARVLWYSEFKIILVLTGWYIAGVPFSFWKSGSLQMLTDVWLKTVLVIFLLTQSLTSLDRIRKLLWAIFLSELIVTAFSIFLPSKSMWVGERIYGVSLGILGWNFVGIAAAMTIPYMAALFVVRRSVLSTILLVATGLALMWMLMLTASRGGFLTVVFSAILSCALVLRGSPRGRIAGVAIAIVLLACIALAPAVFWERMGTVWEGAAANQNQLSSGIEQQAAKESKEERLELLSRSINYTLEHPLFGLGLGNFEQASGVQFTQSDAWRGTHNTYTQISAEAGVPALGLFVSLLIVTVRNMWRISRSLRDYQGSELNLMSRATLAAVLGFVFGAWFVHIAYGYYFFYMVAIGCGLQHIARSSETQSAGSSRSSQLRLSAHNWLQ